MAKAQKQQYGILEGVLVYCKIAQPDNKYQSKDTEFSIGVVVSDDEADQWNEQFKKQPAKVIKTSDFEVKFKFPLPDKFKGDKKVGLITLKRDAVVNGEAVFPDFYPKVLLDTPTERVDITKSRLVANGSVGKVSYRIRENDFGRFAKLANVLIEEANFIEYQSKGGGSVGGEFGSGKPVRSEPENKAATEGRPARQETPQEAAPEKASSKIEDMEDDIPF